MKIVVDRATHGLVQTTHESAVVCNGKYLLDLPPGILVTLNSSSYVLNGGVEDAGSVTTQVFSDWVAGYPEFRYHFHNYFLTPTDQSSLNFLTSETIGLGTYSARAQRGYTGMGTNLGAGTVALMPPNPTTHAGFVSTNTVDILLAPISGGATDRFVPWWSVGEYQTSADISSGYGIHMGTVEPATQRWVGLDPTSVQVYLSNDAGVTWTQVSWLTSVTLPAVGKDVKLAFFNMTSNKIWLNGYALAF